jgi:hypothetical protein
MKQFLIFAIILSLLTTFSLVNAIPLDKRKNPKFEQCKGDVPNPIDLKVSPIPLEFGETATITVSGVANKVIPDGTFLRLGISNRDGDAIFDEAVDFCAISGISCPVEPGTEYTASADFDLPIVDVPDVPGPSNILTRIQIGDDTLSCVRGSVDSN